MERMSWPKREMVEKLKAQYVPGTRVKLINMPNDPRPVPEGTEGTVKYVDDIGSIGVAWDNGQSLSLIPGVDTWEIMK